MAEMTPGEPQFAADYHDRTTAAVKSVLVELGQCIGTFREQFVIIGGAVPWLLLPNTDMPHVGTIDIDVSLDAEALGDGRYARLITLLMNQGYQQSNDLRRFQLVRQVDVRDGGQPISIIIDFLMPRDADIVKNKPPLLDGFAVQRADGADLALNFHQLMTIAGLMPNGGMNSVSLAICSIPALLAMKGYALANRYKQKDAYDIYYSIRNYPGGIAVLADACRPVLDHANGAAGYRFIADKFNAVDGFGPTCVRHFVEGSRILEDRTPEQWQQDAFGQVDAWLRSLGLRS